MLSINKVITEESRRYTPYVIRFDKFKSDSVVPFRVSPKPLHIRRTSSVRKGDENVIHLGPAICEFFHVTVELYNTDERVKELLDQGKPECYKGQIKPEYLFLRPDLILTEEGFFVCEIETSPFGMGLAEMLNRSYCDCGFDTIVARDKFQSYMEASLPENGIVAYSNKCSPNAGQLQYLADQILSGPGRQWSAEKIDENFSSEAKSIYRAFYLSEIFSDKNVQKVVSGDNHFLPSLTPQFEEKAILTLIWDKRFEEYYKTQLGSATFNFLREILPPAWLVGKEEYFSPGLPGGISSTSAISTLGQSKRKWVLKQSGFGEHSSWGEGVTFLHRATRPVLEAKLQEACTSKDVLYICQEFRDGVKRKTQYYADAGNEEILEMDARVRLIMYYSNAGKSTGEIIAAMATCCDDGIYVHGKTTSVQTAVVI